MDIFKVNSLPLKDVIQSLASSFQVNSKSNCSEYYVHLPDHLGQGQITGINFNNGLGIIVYKCHFKNDVRIDFTVDDVHPIKYLYSTKGEVEHCFANDDQPHKIGQYKCAIVASQSKHGHRLIFKKDTDIELVSLEIDRTKFLQHVSCEVNELISPLRNLFEDKLATRQFYHEGFYSLDFKTLFDDVFHYKNRLLVRKFYLEATALKIFVNQLIQFEDDLLNEDESSLLRVYEIEAVKDLVVHIQDNLNQDYLIPELSRKSGLNPNKLQKIFKYLYGSTVNNYITSLRLEKAHELLSGHGYQVSEVALKVGIDNNSYFSKIFKKKFGINPSAFSRMGH